LTMYLFHQYEIHPLFFSGYLFVNRIWYTTDPLIDWTLIKTKDEINHPLPISDGLYMCVGE
jgi:hypothetical protein